MFEENFEVASKGLRGRVFFCDKYLLFLGVLLLEPGGEEYIRDMFLCRGYDASLTEFRAAGVLRREWIYYAQKGSCLDFQMCREDVG